MARLSGLPSEHHHEGPGDAPRRKRGRPSKNQSQYEEAASTGKRTASPSAELSQTKRTRRVSAVSNDEDQIADELAQSFSRSQDGDTIHVQSQTTTTTTTRRNARRQSEPPVTREVDDDIAYPVLSSTQPVAGLTPHLDRVGASRTRFTNNRRARMSMPAQLHIERVDEVDEDDGASHIQYAPMTAVLDNRTRRRLRRSHLSQEVNRFEDSQKQEKKLLLELRNQLKSRDEQIKDLEYRLEARRLGDIDITDEHAEELEAELIQARNEIDELRASSLYNGEDNGASGLSDDEDSELLLINPEELHMSQDLDFEYIPESRYSTLIRERSSQFSFNDLPRLSQISHDVLVDEDVEVTPTIQDQARARYEIELREYAKQISDLQGALRTLTIEIQNMHFLERGSDIKEIILSMQEAFDLLRAEMEKYFPGETAHLTGRELLAKIPELFGGIFIELQEKISLTLKSQKTEILLRRQYEGVLDLLGDAEERRQQLENDVYNLDKANEEKQRTLLDLQEQKTALTTNTLEQTRQINEYVTEINALQGEIQDKDTSIERLRAALNKYEQDVSSLTITINKLEQEFKEQIDIMERDHAAAIASLETELGAEQEGRELAEADAQQKSEYIDELEARMGNMEAEVETITAQVAALGERLREQTQARETAETARDENADLAYDRANTIENLNETIFELNEQITSFRTTLDSERAQREQTETELDSTRDKLEDAVQRLHNANMQAQELRNKLFEVQQEREATIVQLQEEADQREDDLNDQRETEIQLRLAAEQKVEELQQQILELNDTLATVETNLIAMTDARDELEQDRDAQVANLVAQLAELKKKYTALENSTNSTITSLQAQITDLNNQVQRQQAEIKRLNDQLAEQERVYLEDTTVLKEEVDTLKNELALAQEDNEAYRRENESLTDRVADEANEMLKIQDSHHDQVGLLNQAITTHTATIKNLQILNAQQQAEYEASRLEMETEITELRLLGDARVETITSLELSIEQIKERARAAEEDNRVTIDGMLLAQRQLQDQNEQLAAALKKRNADALAAIQEMKIKRIEVRSQNLDLNRVVAGKVTKTSEKVKIGKKGKKKVTKRQWDSGFGVDENVEDIDEVNGEGTIAV